MREKQRITRYFVNRAVSRALIDKLKRLIMERSILFTTPIIWTSIFAVNGT